jgi:hypothetical protein
MKRHQLDGRIRIAVAAGLVLAVGLVGSTNASASPRDNVLNAGKCVPSGWRTLQPRADRSFNGPASCIIFALLGGTFYVPSPPQQQPPPVGGQ